MNRADILDTAKGYVTRDRAATHGKAEDQFATIGQLWGALNGREYSPAQVALMMAALKLVRAWGNPAHADNWIDLAGYAACGGEIATTTNTPNEGLPFAVVKAQRDAERAMDAEPQPMEWPAAPASAPPDGLGDVSATHAAKSAEGTPEARVCGGCRWWGNDQSSHPAMRKCYCRSSPWLLVARESGCDHWQPRSDLASLAARDATAWQGQDGGVE